MSQNGFVWGAVVLYSETLEHTWFAPDFFHVGDLVSVELQVLSQDSDTDTDTDADTDTRSAKSQVRATSPAII